MIGMIFVENWVIFMRLKNVKGSREYIAASPYVIPEEEMKEYKGRWSKEIFGNDHPLMIEIGMGKGKFITTLASIHPEINYIGIEKYSSTLIRAVQKVELNPLSNIRFLRMDAEGITDLFDKGEVDTIFLNFSDPWPKDRHAKRRLENKLFLRKYHEILKENGTIEFKTDNASLFDFALEELKGEPWIPENVTRDLHHDEVLSVGNVMTEYEEKFSSMGNPIYKYVIRRKSE
jgi:tRNA (guanine-N(7)-)-methyltransferase (EC 2.1.1.33)